MFLRSCLAASCAMLAVTFLLAPIVDAAPGNYVWNAAVDNQWDTAGNWGSPGGMPGDNDPGDTVFVVDGALTPAIVDQLVTGFTNAYVGQGAGDGQVNIVAGGSLSNANFLLGRDSGRTGTLDVSGGTLNVAGNVAVGNAVDGSVTAGFFNMSDGTVNPGAVLVGETGGGAPGSTTVGTMTMTGGNINAVAALGMTVSNTAGTAGSSVSQSGGT